MFIILKKIVIHHLKTTNLPMLPALSHIYLLWVILGELGQKKLKEGHQCGLKDTSPKSQDVWRKQGNFLVALLYYFFKCIP